MASVRPRPMDSGRDWIRYLAPFLADPHGFDEQIRQTPSIAQNAIVYIGLCEGMHFPQEQDRASRVRSVIETLGVQRG